MATVSRRAKLLAFLGGWLAQHWARGLVIAGLLTAAALAGIFFLRLDLTFFSIMPENSQAVRDLTVIVEEFPAASTITVVVTGEPETIEEAAGAVAQKLREKEFGKYVSRVQARIDAGFPEEKALMLLPIEKLTELRKAIEAATASTSESEDEPTESAGNNALFRLYRILDEIGSGESPYFLSRDKNRALVFVQPKFTINDFGLIGKVIPLLDQAARSAAARYGARAGLTGLLVVAKDEIVTSQQGLEMSMAIAVVLILALLITSFRMWAVPLIAGIPLLLGVLWTAGIAGFLLGRLNIMSAMYLIALVGLGVDYAIHLLTSYIQFHNNGSSHREAISASMSVSGSGIITGALTTAIAFFALNVAESPIVRELGIVAGIGIICELVAMMLIVPSLLGWRAKRIERRGEPKRKIFASLPSLARAPASDSKGKPPRAISVISLVGILGLLTALLGAHAPRVKVESNIMNMEAAGLESVELQEVMVEEFGMAPDTLSVIAEDLEDARRIAVGLENRESVAAVDSIVSYIPSQQQQQSRGKEIARLGELLKTLAIAPNPLEPLVHRLLPMTESPFLGLSDLPQSVLELYLSGDGKRNLVTIVPSENPWIKEKRENLFIEVGTVTNRATSMVLAADQMTQITERDGRTAAIAALVSIFVLLLLDFRNFKLSILTLVPLAFSFLSLFGIMALAGLKFDFVNIISVPLLIGIGIDDAVHISHRYLYEGKEKIVRTVRLTGRAILLTTLTTIIGFASFIPSIMRAMRSTGIVLSIAMALAFLYSVFLHPALLYLIREKLHLSIEPISFKRGGSNY